MCDLTEMRELTPEQINAMCTVMCLRFAADKAQLAQSAATVGGKVARFRLPIEACHNPAETTIRARAYAPGQQEKK